MGLEIEAVKRAGPSWAEKFNGPGRAELIHATFKYSRSPNRRMLASMDGRLAGFMMIGYVVRSTS